MIIRPLSHGPKCGEAQPPILVCYRDLVTSNQLSGKQAICRTDFRFFDCLPPLRYDYTGSLKEDVR